MRDRLVALARSEPDAEVRSELANTAARLDPEMARGVLQELMRRQEDLADKHLPLRIWWALEVHITRDPDSVLNWVEEAGLWQAPMFTAHIARPHRAAARRRSWGRHPVHAHRSGHQLEGLRNIRAS